MDRLSHASVGILVHDSNGGSFLGSDDSASCDNRDRIDPVVVNFLYVYASASFANDSNIITSNTTICSSVNDGFFGKRSSGRRYTVYDGDSVDLAVNDSVLVYFLRLTSILLWFALSSWGQKSFTIAWWQRLLLCDMCKDRLGSGLICVFMH